MVQYLSALVPVFRHIFRTELEVRQEAELQIY